MVRLSFHFVTLWWLLCPEAYQLLFRIVRVTRGCGQTAGLSDYEVRDVNDDINKLLREKRHWENQIVALGGANYRRNVPMIDEDGKEVPGTKGYKCVPPTPQISLPVNSFVV